MNDGLLLDTNVVLYLLQGDERWHHTMEGYGMTPITISVMTFMEVMIGCRSPQERAELDHFLEDVQIASLDMRIAETACAFLLRKSRSLRSPHLMDAVIAATAAELSIPLLTNNPKDFKRFPGVKIASS